MVTETHTLIFRVCGEPRGKQRPKFTRKGRAYTPKETRAYETEIKHAAMRAAAVSNFVKLPEKSPVKITVAAFFAPPASWGKKKRAAAFAGDIYPTKKPDADNIAKIVCDALNETAYHDDSQIVMCTAAKRFVQSDGEPPCIIVCIEPMAGHSGTVSAALQKCK